MAVVVGSGVRFGPPGYEEAAAEDSLPEGEARELVMSRRALALAARGAVASQAANSRLRSDGSHALRCLFAAAVRTDRHNSFCKNMQVGYKTMGKICQLECPTSVGEQREDLTAPELGVHLDVVIGALDEIGDNNYPALDLGGDGRVETALQEKAFVAWLEAAQRVAFGTLTRFAAEKRTHHSHAVVTPLAVSAGGGMFPEDDDRLLGGADRNGRHWVLLDKSCAGLFTRCIGCFRMFREDGYLHACPVMGQLHQRKPAHKQRPAAAAAAAQNMGGMESDTSRRGL